MFPTRPSVFAGRFYPASRPQCERMLDDMARPVSTSGRPVGGIVPHAGWVYSGPTAALAIAAVGRAQPETVVLFGAAHVLSANDASLYPNGRWETPLGHMDVDEEFAGHVARRGNAAPDPHAHDHEHSIEVQLPMVQRYIGNVRIVPIMVRPGPGATQIGRDCAAAASELGRAIVFLASTDLTHYGPSFAFEPHGRGDPGIRWAKEVNDRRFVQLISDFDADAVISEAALNHNACGAGAVAAGIAAARELGADSYEELEHTTSADRERVSGEEPLTSVGYEAGVFTVSR